MILSIVIPVHNEEGSIQPTVTEFYSTLTRHGIPHEILVINDHSKDGTEQVLKALTEAIPSMRYLNNPGANGFGYAVRAGLENFSGDCVAIVMGDMSDSPDDLVKFYQKMLEGFDCVFGSRFMKGGRTFDYPKVKLVINRMANFIVQVSFGIRYNDTTNAFKLYKRTTINGLKPFLSPHFNLTLELPLKSIVRGYTYAVVPNTWTNRKAGKSKLKIREMGSRYFFILLYCLIEKFFSRGDFRKEVTAAPGKQQLSDVPASPISQQPLVLN